MTYHKILLRCFPPAPLECMERPHEISLPKMVAQDVKKDWNLYKLMYTERCKWNLWEGKLT